MKRNKKNERKFFKKTFTLILMGSFNYFVRYFFLNFQTNTGVIR